MAPLLKVTSRSKVLKKLRRGSKDTTKTAQSGGDTRDLPECAPSDESTSAPKGPSILDLPAEIRNEIYAFVVCEVTLTLPEAASGLKWKSRLEARRTKAVPLPISGLLLASKQTRREYQAILFSTAEVHVDVKDFDFESLIRVSTRFDDLESKALQSNESRFIILNTQNCTAKALLALRRWLDFRNSHRDGISWNYKFPVEKLLPPGSMGRMRLLRELEYYADTISTLEVDLQAPQQTELRLIVEAFETEIRWLDGDVGWLGQHTTTAARNARGLMGGGLR